MKIIRDDKVMVISGSSKGVVGKVLSVDPENNKLIVEGANVHKRHQRPRRQGEEGGIIDKPTPLYASKVMLVCPKCGKPTRVGYKYLENGDKVRYCRSKKNNCGAVISVVRKHKKGE